MKYLNNFTSGFFLVLFLAVASCGEGVDKVPEKLPYFDLKGFIEIQVKNLDSSNVTLINRVQGKEVRKEATLSTADWIEEFDTFIQADINKQSLFLAYDTQVKNNVLTHSLFPESKGKLKEMKVTYIDDQVVSISLKMSEENLFYKSNTFADLYMNNATQKVDHYSIETTQKIWFLDANNIKIMGAIRP